MTEKSPTKKTAAKKTAEKKTTAKKPGPTDAVAANIAKLPVKGNVDS